MTRLLTYFARGTLVLLPVVATAYILVFVVRTLDELLGLTIPGLGLLLALVLIIGVGVLVSNVVGDRIYRLFDELLSRLPLVKLLYSSLRDLVEAFVGEKRTFGQPVAVRLTAGSETRVLGFLSRDGVPRLGLPEHVAVYVPQAYNIGGQVLILPRAQIEPLDVPSTELFTFVLSGGASGLGVGARSSRPL
jgi:uncharacterized membrane protein